MRVIDDRSIRTKVLIVPLILIMALLVVSGLAFYGIVEQKALVKAAHDVASKKIDQIGQFIILSEQVQSDVYRISVLRSMNLNREQIEPARTRLLQGLNDLTIIYGELQIRRPLDPEEAAILERLRPPLEAFRRQAKQAAMVVMDDPSFGALLVRSAMAPFAEFRTILAEFQDYQRETMERISAESKEQAQVVAVAIVALVLLIGLSATFATLWLSTRLISAPITAMTALMHRLADGDLSLEIAGQGRRDEIGEMARAVEVFRGDALQKERLDRELRQKEELYRLLFQQTPAGVFHYDQHLRLTDCNQRLAAILQSSTEKLIGLDLNTLRDRRVLPALKTALEGREGFYQGQYQATTGPAQVWIFLRTAPVRDHKGRIKGGIGLLEDITERRRAEEKIEASLREKVTMLKEIHHRVKNNLQVISSLLGLQSGHIEDEASRKVFQESQNRVRVMAQIHTMLYQSTDLARVDFSGFVGDLGSRLLQSYRKAGSRIEIHTDIGDLCLNIETSIPCGLILNELIANALKHAFPEGSEGNIDISMKQEEGRYVLKVRDNGVGFSETIDFRDIPSLGLKLVNLMVGQMDGAIDMRIDGGTVWTMTFPVKDERVWQNG